MTGPTTGSVADLVATDVLLDVLAVGGPSVTRVHVVADIPGDPVTALLGALAAEAGAPLPEADPVVVAALAAALGATRRTPAPSTSPLVERDPRGRVSRRAVGVLASAVVLVGGTTLAAAAASQVPQPGAGTSVPPVVAMVTGQTGPLSARARVGASPERPSTGSPHEGGGTGPGSPAAPPPSRSQGAGSSARPSAVPSPTPLVRPQGRGQGAAGGTGGTARPDTTGRRSVPAPAGPSRHTADPRGTAADRSGTGAGPRDRSGSGRDEDGRDEDGRDEDGRDEAAREDEIRDQDAREEDERDEGAPHDGERGGIESGEGRA